MSTTSSTESPLAAAAYCLSNDASGGCGGVFPRKPYSGLCHRCLNLEALDAAHSYGSAESDAIKALPQCLSCGNLIIVDADGDIQVAPPDAFPEQCEPCREAGKISSEFTVLLPTESFR
ncbi:hypothetical protein CYLTODRAFT_150660 [Cylindrobasidium torrendii FP15055 ss-10]|uniref:Uncharacterized protein n=1 Tax=Cylindrobasidium torrendii FP15055 ss-10 TaxID=1314674 RepID=A0A0D7AYH7_9AGAR|nr:hypothetical protein CYLTODRAFT_150660 [Cylindrobasidium torrendii FP15055 ss-10]